MAKLFILFTAVALVFMLGLGIGSGYAMQGNMHGSNAMTNMTMSKHSKTMKKSKTSKKSKSAKSKKTLNAMGAGCL